MLGYVNSFESFGSVDGPGVRFVVFLNGCCMRCKYCHNPDTWEMGGDAYTPAEVLNRALKYKSYWGKNGGITVSGGEPMLQMQFVTELFTAAKEKGISTCLDTSGIVFNADNTSEVDELLDVTDLVMLDIKHIDDEKHKELTGHSNKSILEFARYLSDKNVPVWIRHVVVPGLTLDEKFLERLGNFVGNLSNVERIETLPYHSLAIPKYEKLGMEYPLTDTQNATTEQADWAKKIIENGIKAANAR